MGKRKEEPWDEPNPHEEEDRKFWKDFDAAHPPLEPDTSWRLINGFHVPTQEEKETFFSEFDTLPYGSLLASTFKARTIEQSWMVGEGIVGNIQNLEQDASMHLTLRQDLDVILRFYNGPLEEIPESFGRIGASEEIAIITSRARETGVWAYGRGYQKRWGLNIRFPNGIYLPTKLGKWVLGALSDFAQSASEFYDPLHEQPTFRSGWDGIDSEQ